MPSSTTTTTASPADGNSSSKSELSAILHNLDQLNLRGEQSFFKDSLVFKQFTRQNFEFVAEKLFKFYYSKENVEVIDECVDFILLTASLLIASGDGEEESFRAKNRSSTSSLDQRQKEAQQVLCKHVDQLLLILSYHACSSTDLIYQTCLYNAILKTLSSRLLGILTFKYARQVTLVVVRELEYASSSSSSNKEAADRFHVLLQLLHQVYQDCEIVWGELVGPVLVSLCSWWRANSILAQATSGSIGSTRERDGKEEKSDLVWLQRNAVLCFISQKLLVGTFRESALQDLALLKKVKDPYFENLFSQLLLDPSLDQSSSTL